MAEKEVSATRRGSWLVFTWLGVTENDTFQKIYLNHNVSDILVEGEGTWGGSTLTLDGWVVLEGAKSASVDPGGSAVSIIADASSSVRDAYPFFRPKHSGGTGTLINVNLFMKVA